MKKPVALLLGMIMIFSLAACTGTTLDTPFGTTPNSNSQMTTNGTNDTKKPDSITSGAIGTIGVTDPTVTTEPTDTPTAKGKTLVVYFSRSSSGNTEKIAKRIVEATGADLVKIEAAEPYIGSYNDVAYGRAKDEHDTNARPEVVASIYAAIDMGRYGMYCGNTLRNMY